MLPGWAATPHSRVERPRCRPTSPVTQPCSRGGRPSRVAPRREDFAECPSTPVTAAQNAPLGRKIPRGSPWHFSGAYAALAAGKCGKWRAQRRRAPRRAGDGLGKLLAAPLAAPWLFRANHCCALRHLRWDLAPGGAGARDGGSQISPRNHFLSTPLLASTSTGTLEFRSIVEFVRDSVRAHGAEFHLSRAEGIDLARRQVRCASEVDGVTYDEPYDMLVVGVGARTNSFGIPGVEEHAHFLKEVCCPPGRPRPAPARHTPPTRR